MEKCRCNQSLEHFELGRSDIFLEGMVSGMIKEPNM